MDHVSLGRTGLRVSPLCLGTMNFGPFATVEESFAIMDKALEVGVNFFDTANVYGRRPGEGYTEQIIGDWLAQGGGRREQVVLATKVYGGMNRKEETNPNFTSGLSARKIKLCCEDSLKRLKTEYIDLYQMHHIDRSTPWEEIWQAMEQLVREGKVLYVGSSNFAGWHIATANQEASKRNFMGLVCEQTKYNLMCREPELEVFPACRHYGVGMIPYSPLAGGRLAGNRHASESGRRSGKAVQASLEQCKEQLEKWEAFCSELGEEPANVAVAWMLQNPVVTAPIIGPRTMDQLTGALRSVEIKLSEENMKQIDDIFPGPGGEAPEAYAW